MSRRATEAGIEAHLDDRDGRCVLFVKGDLIHLKLEEARRVVRDYDAWRVGVMRGYQSVDSYDVKAAFHLTLPEVKAVVRAYDRYRKRLFVQQKRETLKAETT